MKDGRGRKRIWVNSGEYWFRIGSTVGREGPVDRVVVRKGTEGESSGKGRLRLRFKNWDIARGRRQGWQKPGLKKNGLLSFTGLLF